MKSSSWWTFAVLSLVLASCGGEPGSDPGTAKPVASGGTLAELVNAPGRDLVMIHCVRCHGPRQFLQQRGSRDTWRGLIRWMQKDHGMEQLAGDREDRIVEYLATHYGPEASGRRRPIPAELMPPNPYAPNTPEPTVEARGR
ncbi:MAG: hypothetical protein NXI31_12980 [bacterium]|nr:hypothetical protein [bacterium]